MLLVWLETKPSEVARPVDVKLAFSKIAGVSRLGVKA